jgi:hypothetical protein
MPAITDVSASLVILLDAILETFAAADSVGTGSPCTINAVNAALKPCGLSVVDALSDLAHTVVAFASGLFLGIGLI